MSAPMYGADADQLDQLAARFLQTADDLDTQGGALTGILNNISWLGDTAGKFLSDWSGVQLPNIGLSTHFLRETGHKLQQQAAQQRAASQSNGQFGFAVPGTLGAPGGGWGTPGFPGFPLPWGPGVPGFPFAPSSPAGPNGWDLFGSGVDMVDFMLDASDDLTGAAALFGGTALFGGLLEHAFDELGWSELALVPGAFAQVGNIGGAFALIGEYTGKIMPRGGLLSVAGGIAGFMSEWTETLTGGFDVGSGLEMSGSGMAVVGGALMLVPFPPVIAIGLGVSAVGAVFGAAGWAVDNWSTITDTAAKVQRTAEDLATGAVEVADRALDTAAQVIGHGLNAVSNTAADVYDDAMNAIGDGFRTIGGWLS